MKQIAKTLREIPAGAWMKLSATHLVEWWMLYTLKLHGMSWGVKTTCFKAPGVSLGGSGVSIGGVRSLRVGKIFQFGCCLLLRGRGSHGSHG